MWRKVRNAEIWFGGTLILGIVEWRAPWFQRETIERVICMGMHKMNTSSKSLGGKNRGADFLEFMYPTGLKA